MYFSSLADIHCFQTPYRGSESHSSKKWECLWGELLTSVQVWRLQDFAASCSHDGSDPVIVAALWGVVTPNTEGNVCVVCRWQCGWDVLHTLCCVLYSQTTESTGDSHNNCSSTACSRSALTSSATWKREFNVNNVTLYVCRQFRLFTGSYKHSKKELDYRGWNVSHSIKACTNILMIYLL